MAKRKLPQWLLPLAYMLAFGVVWFSFQHFSNTVQPKQVPYSDFLLEVRSGHVSEVGIDEQLFVATLKADAARKEPAPEIATERIPGMDETSLLGELESQDVTFSGHATKGSWWTLVLPWVVPILFFVLIAGYASRRAGQTPGPAHFRREPREDPRLVERNQGEF